MKISKEKLLESLGIKKITEHLYENVELKRSWSREHGEKASMLCNGNPDTDNFIVIGIEDNGDLSNHNEEWLKKTLEVVSQQFNSDLDPSLALVEIETLERNGSHLILIHLKNPGVVVKWRHEAYSGCGTTKKKLTPPETLELGLKLPGLHDLTKQKVTFAPIPQELENLRNLLKEPADTDIIKKYNLDNLCGKILIGKTPYRIVKYSNTGSITLNETRFGLAGLLTTDFYDEVRAYYSSHSIERLKISNDLLREALGNCIAHAAYHENSGEIIVELLHERVQFTNLAYNEYISLANKWFSAAHKSPNPFLMEALRTLNRADELGRGKKRILTECLCNGFQAPYITITDAGRYKRWSLKIDFSHASSKHQQAFEAIKKLYNLEKSLIAYSLVLWREKPFSEIAKCFDSYEAKLAAEILSDPRGPIFYWKEQDKIVPHRWLRILLEEGKSSKELTIHEKNTLYDVLYRILDKYNGGYVTPKDVREIAHLSDTASDKSLSSRLLTEWVSTGKLEKIKKGTYKFKAQVNDNSSQTVESILEDITNTAE
jgi:hypothetical protein